MNNPSNKLLLILPTLVLMNGTSLVGSVTASPASSCAHFPLIWQGDLQQPNWQKRWGVLSERAWGREQRQILRQPGERYPQILRVTYPQGSASPASTRNQNTPKGGTQFLANLNLPPQEQLCFSYAVRFSNNFDFAKGGKLPGLYGGTKLSGGRIPDGNNGFSTRYMWRRRGDGELYAYLPTSQVHGTSLGKGNWQFQAGVWTKLEQWVSLNQPGQADGRIRVWVNGHLVLDQKNLTFRNTRSLQIEGIFFSTFFGGNDASWATPRSVYADFADFQVRRPR